MNTHPTTPDTAPRVVMRMNRNTVALGSTLVAMWYAAASQSNGAIYLLTFAAAGIAMLSWVYARWNLRCTEWVPGELQSIPQSACHRLPFRIKNGSSRAVCSLEIAAAGARAPVFLRQLDPGATHFDELIFPTQRLVPGKPLTLVVRSLYPLGFFTAERKLQVSPEGRVVPEAEGDLPLPLPDRPNGAVTLTTTSVPGAASSGGDDYSGVRPWQAGDSPRHIDWKAAARERPLMTKQWTSDTPSVVPLEWSQLDLPEESRVRQMIQWVGQCERASQPWTLILPERTLGPGCSPQLARECRSALAALMPEGALPKTTLGGARVPVMHETTATVPRSTVSLLCGSLLLCLLPMIGEVSLIGMAFLLLGAFLRVTFHRQKAPLYLRLAIMLVGGALVYFTEPERRSMEAATALLFVFIGGKMLESRTPRDFQVLAVLGWFLCMCALSMEQSLGWTLYAAGVFLLITTAWLRLRCSAGGLRSSFGVASSLLAQALPLMLLMFLLFPRGTEGFVNTLARRGNNRSGLSNVLEPGSVARVALSNETAFLAEFPEGNPAPAQRYWRGLVLWQCEGLRWTRGRNYLDTGLTFSAKGSRRIQQRITLKPHGDLWLPALDRVIKVSGVRFRALIDDDGAVIADRPADTVLRYTVESLSPAPPTFLTDAERKQATQIPLTISGEVEKLATSFRPTPETTDEEVVTAALQHLRTTGYEYTLEPGTYAPDTGLEEFVMRRKLGFCEHFSAAFATLLRLADVPTRVVIGFLGGEFRDTRGHWVVRNSDAHAWVEVWIKGKGWVRVDPTAALAPGRLSGDLETFLAGGPDSDFALQRDTWWWQAWMSARDTWDQLNFEWYERIVTADDDTQSDTLTFMGLGKWNWSMVLTALAGGVALILLAVLLWLRWGGRHPDPAARLWLKVCRRLARAGVPRFPGEAASTYAQRAGAALPTAADSLREISRLYNELRFGPDRQHLDALRTAVGRLPRLTRPPPSP